MHWSFESWKVPSWSPILQHVSFNIRDGSLHLILFQKHNSRISSENMGLYKNMEVFSMKKNKYTYIQFLLCLEPTIKHGLGIVWIALHKHLFLKGPLKLLYNHEDHISFGLTRSALVCRILPKRHEMEGSKGLCYCNLWCIAERRAIPLVLIFLMLSYFCKRTKVHRNNSPRNIPWYRFYIYKERIWLWYI